MFVDHIKIFARAGDGGNGSVHFRREKYIPEGGPDGGDGGRGGHIIFKVDIHTDNLKEFFFKSRLVADDGKGGSGSRSSGKSGEDRVYKVPAGTLVYKIADSADDEEFAEGEMVADLITENEEFILCKGGKGGKGNIHFKSSINRTPQEFTPGEDGEQGRFYLELRKIAEAGFVGFPNAGKSTLLSKLSAAKPKIANYPFTTLQPMVGVMQFPGFRRATIADIPGLIEGAHENVGLGHDFLRHITRCQLLLFVVDTAGSEGRNPIEDLRILRKELSLYDEGLAKFPWLIVANKMDLPEAAENLAEIKRLFPKIEVIPISAEDGTGMEAFRERLDVLIGKPG